MVAAVPTWVPSYTCPSATQTVVCPAECYHLMKTYDCYLCSQRMTRAGGAAISG